MLDELIVRHGAAEPRGERLLQDVVQVGREKRHPLAGQLLEAPDGVQMRPVADLVERAAAVALLKHRVVADLRVQEDLRRGGPERRQEQGVDRLARDRLARSLRDREGVEEDVDGVGHWPATGPPSAKPYVCTAFAPLASITSRRAGVKGSPRNRKVTPSSRTPRSPIASEMRTAALA